MTLNASNAIINGFAPDSNQSASGKNSHQSGFTPEHFSGNLLELWLEQEPEADDVNRFEACDICDCGY